MVTRRSREALRAAALLAVACCFDGPFRLVVSLPLVLVCLVMTSLALTHGRHADARPFPPILWTLLASVAALGIAMPGSIGPPWIEILRRAFSAFGVVAVGIVSGNDATWRRRALVASVAGATVLCFIIPAAVPNPQIDVVPWTDTAVRAFLHAVHPYTVQAPDVYHGGADFGFVVSVYPYMPATLLAFAPFVAIAGDFRYALAACVPATIWLVRRAGHRAGADPRLLDAATLMIALHPTMPVVVRSGWAEPLLSVVSAAVAVALVEGRSQLAAIGMLMLPALKQYALAPVILWAAGAGRRARPRVWIIAAACAALTVLPFLIWNAHATLEGMLFQMRAPVRPRLTSISIPALLANYGSLNLPVWVSAAAQLAVSGALAAAGVGATVSGLFAGSAVALLVTFILGWQGFVNYYVWIGTLLVLAAVTDRPTGTAEGAGR
jgi:hypothetical protein